SNIPPPRIFSEFNYKIKNFVLTLNTIYSFEKKGVNPRYLLVNAGFSFLYNPNLKLSIIANNINNVVAYRSLDPNSMPLPSRNIKFQVSYTF
ncbi:MAG: hypothetical protein ABIL37_05990, partial [candidate division WOR-3 bacterium]